ncbi:probable RNA-directed DNA polymerase from transposon BS [Trichonephila clavipes]|nr:probable RNA-directed DNA polymerase from transposon BS [Trichonephila clavipes]
MFRKTRSTLLSLKHASSIATSDDQKANVIANSFKTNFTENKRPDNYTNNIDSDVTSTLENFFFYPPDSSRSQHFPNNWKTATVFPINKPGKNKQYPDSYRPISLISSLSKIAGHIILNRINKFIIDTNFLNPNQYGFTRQLSTYHPLLRLTEKISAGFQRSRFTGAVFLDIQKAFDRVWVSGLIYKLIINHFPAPLIHIINSYLVNRTFKVRVNNTLSLPHSGNIDVTQGSLLGHILFNIYLNDIPSYPQTMLNLYVDDSAILATFKNPKTVTSALNKHLALLENYFNQWKIKINVEKAVAVLFTKRIKSVTPPTLYSTPLQWSQTTKYLGLVLDKNLTFKHHILHSRDKFRNALRSIYPLICRNSEKDMYIKVLLYTAVLRPILSYGSPEWGYATNQLRGNSLSSSDQSQCSFSTSYLTTTSKGSPQTVASSPTYSLPPLRILQLSSQPIRKLRAPHPDLSTNSGSILCSVMGRRNAPRSMFQNIYPEDADGIGLGVEPMDNIVDYSEELMLCRGFQAKSALEVQDYMISITVIDNAIVITWFWVFLEGALKRISKQINCVLSTTIKAHGVKTRKAVESFIFTRVDSYSFIERLYIRGGASERILSHLLRHQRTVAPSVKNL